MKPCTNFAEFSLKKRWRYMMRMSAWQLRFKTLTESLISSQNPSAAREPRSGSLSREKSFSNSVGEIKQHVKEVTMGKLQSHTARRSYLSQCITITTHSEINKMDKMNVYFTLSVSTVNRGWYLRSKALATWKHQQLYCPC